MTINGIDIEVERKNIKNVHLSVYPPNGRVHISVPETFSDSRIEMYVLQKWVWIEEKREALTSYSYQSDREFVSGEAHFYKGQKYRLKVNRHTTGAFCVFIQGDYIVVNVHTDTTPDNIRATLYQWYKSQLTPIIQNFLEKWQPKLGVKLDTWEIRLMDARWGSCSQETKKAYFNVELAKKPVDCVEYVVVHELLHLLERTHTERFYHLLDMSIPAWQELKQKLNEFPI